MTRHKTAMTDQTQHNASQNPDSAAANSMWGGRFSESNAAIMQAINASIDVDKRLYAQDIQGSMAHARMLAKQGIITGDDAEVICKGLAQIKTEIQEGRFVFSQELEDIHMNVEARLKAIVGEPAGRLHTARSRNDQVATDFRLWLRDQIDYSVGQIDKLLTALLDQAEKHAETVMPGYTHLQPAQPVTFGHHLMAYVEMLTRDKERLQDARKRLNRSPLGSAAMAGTGFAIDREATAAALGFDGPTRNSMDAVADRDFALEFLAAGAICLIHLSRLAEELVIWSTPSIGFVTMSDKFSTGSSIMPQKRNPDAAELIRAKPGRLLGAFQTLAVVMKGLPMTYAKDMQEDKEITFAAADALDLSLAAMAGMIEDLTAHPAAMRAACQKGHLTATDLADWLVRELGMPFRDAHHVTGRVVVVADQKDCPIWDLELADLQSVEPRITAQVFEVLSIDASVASRRSFGGTAPERVKAAVAEARARLNV